MYNQTKDLTASSVLYRDKIALRCHIFNLETYKNANLVCTWCMCSVYQSYTRFSSYIHLFLVYNWHIAVISNIPGVYSHLPIIVCNASNHSRLKNLSAFLKGNKFYDLQAGHLKKTKTVYWVANETVRSYLEEISTSLMDLNTTLRNLFR